MKTIEEKAKAYDKAVEKLRDFYRDYDTVSCLIDVKEELEHIFPELKESEDEKIRKALISAINNICAGDEGLVTFNGFSKEQVLAWLEKQGKHANFRNKIQIGDKVTRNDNGELVNLSQLERVAKKLEKQEEQKPADKVEPKFHKGDWIVYDGWTTQILQVCQDGYVNNHQGFIPKEREDAMRLWDITKDAKDGDVLVASDKSLFIYDGSINENGSVGFHIAFTEDMDILLNSDDGCGGKEKDSCHPTTKEQREQLEKAMADAGYTFDFDKKELKKIQQTPAWSKEDDENIMMIENRFSDLLEYIREDSSLTKHRKNTLKEDVIGYFNWIKSLKERYTWKPSDEQMNTLKEATNIAGGKYKSCLNSLYEDLKKLKEE